MHAYGRVPYTMKTRQIIYPSESPFSLCALRGVSLSLSSPLLTVLGSALSRNRENNEKTNMQKSKFTNTPTMQKDQNDHMHAQRSNSKGQGAAVHRRRRLR